MERKERIEDLKLTYQYTGLLKNMDEVGLPTRLAYEDWDTLKIGEDSDDPFKQCEKYGAKIVQAIDQRLSLYLFGEYATGKTQASVLIARDALLEGRKPHIANMRQLYSMFTDPHYELGEFSIVNRLAMQDVLIIDDLTSGQQKYVEFVKDILTLTLYKRQGGGATIINSNMPLDNFIDTFGKKFASRFEPYISIHFDQPLQLHQNVDDFLA